MSEIQAWLSHWWWAIWLYQVLLGAFLVFYSVWWAEFFRKRAEEKKEDEKEARRAMQRWLRSRRQLARDGTMPGVDSFSLQVLYPDLLSTPPSSKSQVQSEDPPPKVEDASIRFGIVAVFLKRLFYKCRSLWRLALHKIICYLSSLFHPQQEDVSINSYQSTPQLESYYEV